MGNLVEDGGLAVRPARPEDFDTIIAVIDDWWGRPASRDLTRLFLDHFFGTSLIAEHGGELAGFLIGFLSPSKHGQACAGGPGLAGAVRTHLHHHARRLPELAIRAVASIRQA